MNFRKPVSAVQFSPNGKYFALTHGNHVQVWNTPTHLAREFAPFVLHREYTGHQDDVLSITWSRTSKYFLTTSRDMTARLYTTDPLDGFKPKLFGGHRDAVVGAWFSEDEKTVSIRLRMAADRADLHRVARWSSVYLEREEDARGR